MIVSVALFLIALFLAMWATKAVTGKMSGA